MQEIERPADDCFAPPDEPCEVFCLHCRRIYDSSLIRWVGYRCKDGTHRGFWRCPVPGCDGAGFTFDIFPTDPDHPANAGWCECDEFDDDCDEQDEELADEFDDLQEFDLGGDDEFADDGFAEGESPWRASKSLPGRDLRHGGDRDPNRFPDTSELPFGFFDREPLDEPDATDPSESFEPPREWTPQCDEEGSEGCDLEPPRQFTLDEFQQAVTEGVYERQDAEFRARMAEEEEQGRLMNDDDIPF